MPPQTPTATQQSYWELGSQDTPLFARLNIVPLMGMQILTKANLALNASECVPPSFLIDVSRKCLFIDGVFFHVHVIDFVQRTT